MGRWYGGEGDTTGTFLQVRADGAYVGGITGRQPNATGVVVATVTTVTFYSAKGGHSTARWEYTNASGIKVLSLTFEDGSYYSYAKA